MAAPTIPASVQLATIEWLWTAAIGDETTVPTGLTVTFDPAPEWLQYTAATPHMTIAPWSVTATIGPDGVLLGPDGSPNVTLLPTDDTDLNPSAWTYQVTVRQGSLILMDFPIAAPGGVTTDLATVTPIAGSTGNAVVQGPPWVADGTVDGQVPTWDEATGKYIPTAATGSVDSVNGVTPVAGDVTLTPSDIGAQPAGSYATAAQGAKADTAVQPGSLAPVATSGSYADLTGTPPAPSWSTLTGKPATFPPVIGTGAADAMAGNTPLPIGIPDPSAVADGKVLTTLSGAATWGSSSSAFELRGTGFPEGVVTASPGTYYTDSAGTNGAWRWLKTSGTGNTGWVVTVGDTGWRDITGILDAAITPGTGKMLLRRTGSDVRLLGSADITVANGAFLKLLTVPSGFQVAVGSGAIFADRTPATSAYLYVPALTVWYVQPKTTTLRGSTPPLITDDLWPTTLPGTPA